MTYGTPSKAWLSRAPAREQPSRRAGAPPLHPGDAVDALPKQVGVAVVPGVLLDHVDVDPPEAAVLLHEAASIGQLTLGALLAGGGDLRVPGGECVAQGGARRK